MNPVLLYVGSITVIVSTRLSLLTRSLSQDNQGKYCSLLLLMVISSLLYSLKKYNSITLTPLEYVIWYRSAYK